MKAIQQDNPKALNAFLIFSFVSCFILEIAFFGALFLS